MIAAINLDPNAPIFEFAHYGLIGNALDLLPELADAFAEHLESARARQKTLQASPASGGEEAK